MAVVTTPAYPEATALQLVAEQENREDDTDMDESQKKIAELETRLKLAEQKNENDEEMLEVRTASYESSMDNAVLLRTAVNNNWYSYRMFHAGMATPIPVANGGTGGATPKAALNSLGIFYASELPASGTDGQICLVPV